ncbi:hypothetical protein HID58_066273 [Brassica napus]|uniref:Uncharacterized protein n=1 Tax=Brassica napus TaxID=3708 RepID=A0ABQ7ZF96_BRANA|nr:hypothetical protein HID58_066273 [Brassica napus]
MQDFQSAVTTCNLTDLAATGPTFTWTNKRPVNPIAKKQDRVLVNENWLDKYPQSYTSLEPSGVSDHVRCWIRLETPPPGNKRPFKFFNFLADHPDFMDFVSTVWESTEPLFHSTSALYRFHRKLNLLKPILRRLNKNKFGNIPQRTKEAFDVLCDKQKAALQQPCDSGTQVLGNGLKSGVCWSVEFSSMSWLSPTGDDSHHHFNSGPGGHCRR